MGQNHLEDFYNNFLGCTSRVFGLVGLEKKHRIYVSNKFSGDADSDGAVTTLKTADLFSVNWKTKANQPAHIAMVQVREV